MSLRSSPSSPAGLPGQCKDISSSDATKSTCKVSWEAPEDDGDSPIISYTLERREASKKTYMPVTSGSNVLTYDVKDLYTNCEYYFRVKAVNQVGAGEYLELRMPVITEEVKRKSLVSQSMNQSLKLGKPTKPSRAGGGYRGLHGATGGRKHFAGGRSFEPIQTPEDLCICFDQ